MRKKLLVISILLFTSSYSFGQSYFYDDKYYDEDILWEAGASVGLMNGVTDVGEKLGSAASPAFYDWKSSHINASIFLGVMYKSIVEGRIELSRGTIAGNDANSNSAYVRSRNFNYESNIFELAFIGAFHPLLLRDKETLPVVSPYIMAGIGIFSFNPKTLYNGQWIGLRFYNTEGQNTQAYPARKQYNLRALSIPVGLGLKYEFSAKYNIRMEGLYRFTTSDYLDDVSTIYVDRSILPSDLQRILAHRYTELDPQLDRTGQPRGNANNKDAFFTINLRVGYVIGRKKIR